MNRQLLILSEQQQTDSNATLSVVEPKVTDPECASGVSSAASGDPIIHQTQLGW